MSVRSGKYSLSVAKPLAPIGWPMNINGRCSLPGRWRTSYTTLAPGALIVLVVVSVVTDSPRRTLRVRSDGTRIWSRRWAFGPDLGCHGRAGAAQVAYG